MNSKTMITKDIWNRFTVKRENQNRTISTNTNDERSQIERRTCVILIANLKFLLTIKIKHNLNKIYNLIDALCYSMVITQIAANIK